jgi:hypothetical protein
MLHRKAELSPNFTTLALKTDSIHFVKKLLQNPAFFNVKHLYLSGLMSSPASSGVDFLPLVRKADNLKTLTVAPSLETAVKEILRVKHFTTELIVISPAPDFDSDSEEDLCAGFGLWD